MKKSILYILLLLLVPVILILLMQGKANKTPGSVYSTRSNTLEDTSEIIDNLENIVVTNVHDTEIMYYNTSSDNVMITLLFEGGKSIEVKRFAGVLEMIISTLIDEAEKSITTEYRSSLKNLNISVQYQIYEDYSTITVISAQNNIDIAMEFIQYLFVGEITEETFLLSSSYLLLQQQYQTSTDKYLLQQVLLQYMFKKYVTLYRQPTITSETLNKITINLIEDLRIDFINHSKMKINITGEAPLDNILSLLEKHVFTYLPPTKKIIRKKVIQPEINNANLITRKVQNKFILKFTMHSLPFNHKDYPLMRLILLYLFDQEQGYFTKLQNNILSNSSLIKDITWEIYNDSISNYILVSISTDDNTESAKKAILTSIRSGLSQLQTAYRFDSLMKQKNKLTRLLLEDFSSQQNVHSYLNKSAMNSLTPSESIARIKYLEGLIKPNIDQVLTEMDWTHVLASYNYSTP